jgi:hypothetical protein
MRQDGKMLHSKGQRYTLPFKCHADGEMLLVLKLYKNFNDTWRAKKTVYAATEERLEEYRAGLEKSNIRRKARSRRSKIKKRTAQTIANQS